MTAKRQRQMSRWWAGIGSIAFLLGSVGSTVQAAERIYVSFSFLERSIAVQDLETFAATGEITGDLASYVRFFKPAKLERFRLGLSQKVEISHVAMSQFLYTQVGEGLIRRVEAVVRTKSGHGSFYAIRSALILAAADPDGLSALSLMRYFPTKGVQIDLQAALAITRDLQQTIQDTNRVVAAIAQQSTAEPLPLGPEAVALQQLGPHAWTQITMEFDDRSTKRIALTGKSRQFVADLYFPQMLNRDSHPVIVISHGFNSNRNTYAYLAKHLVSHGFVVVMPEHLGSNTNRLGQFLSGTAQEIMNPAEFVDRPLDVTHVLDELPVRSQTDPRIPPNLNLQHVGFIGHSFGGYTGFALTGQPLNLAPLPQACQQLKTTLNLSFLLQCQARRLPRLIYDLTDQRIGAIVAISPIGSILLGPQHYRNIQIPVMMLTGSDDAVAPALPEQIGPFNHFEMPDRYLVLMRRGTHFSTIGADDQTDKSLPRLETGGPSEIARQYLTGLSLAFMQSHIEDQATARPYLTPNYAAAISHPDLPLHLTQTAIYNAETVP